MFTRQALIRTALASAVLAVGLAGCGTMDRMMGGGKGVTLSAKLSGASEVPPTSSAGSGDAEVQFDRGTSMLKYRVSYTGLTGRATGAHIHGPAAPGANAGIVVPFSNVGQSPITGETRLTEAQANQLLAGQWYVNVHTAAHPGGEIRGQLTQSR